MSVVVEVWREIAALRRSEGSCPSSPQTRQQTPGRSRSSGLHGAGVREVGGTETVCRSVWSVSRFRHGAAAAKPSPTRGCVWMLLKTDFRGRVCWQSTQPKIQGLREPLASTGRPGAAAMPPAPSRHTGQNDRPDQETLLYRPVDRSIGQIKDILGLSKPLYTDIFIGSINLWTGLLGWPMCCS